MVHSALRVGRPWDETRLTFAVCDFSIGVAMKRLTESEQKSRVVDVTGVS
jgi:hypothetical protein